MRVLVKNSHQYYFANQKPKKLVFFLDRNHKFFN